MKLCGKCRLHKPLGKFSKAGSGFQSWCRDCNQRNLARYNRSKKYGITHSVGLELRDRRCDLCGAEPGSGSSAHHIDHCHKSGAVRGVLCHGCNTRLGVIEKYLVDPDRIDWYLNRGADYRAVDREA